MEKITINGVEYKLTPVENESPNSFEAKFHEGDWCYRKDGGFKGPIKITKVLPLSYEAVDYIGYHHSIEKYCLENNYHLWTIADAKDGDVIFYDDGWTCIFKYIHGIWYSSYCFITADGEFHTGYERHAVDAKLNGNANPATKEQRDFLFSKMNEAGYEWDAEKMELKKCTPIFTVGDTIIKKPVSDINFGYFTITDIAGGKYWYNDRIICEISEQNDWELVKQKPAERESETQPKQCWSEEDEKMYRRLHNLIYSTPYCDSRKELSDWLEFLKDRVQPQNHWKPSEVKDADLIIHTIITECCDWLAICTDLSHDLIEDCRNLMLAVKDEEFKVQKGE